MVLEITGMMVCMEIVVQATHTLIAREGVTCMDGNQDPVGGDRTRGVFLSESLHQGGDKKVGTKHHQCM